ncbi:hypothetical protein [Halosimplex marinum]|uniref:hypothetical protein n=1 Tax=Halosimplex marinum TaxID=3396620 RepID=UPI003F557F44
MAINELLVAGVLLSSIFLILTTPVVAKALWQYYSLLAVYHPTDDLLKKYKPDADVDYKTESWLYKFGLVYVINFITVTPTLMLVTLYGTIVLGQPLTVKAIFSAGIVILAINTSFRIGDKITTDWGRDRNPDTRSELMTFGFSFYTSLWVLTAIGGVTTVVNGRAGQMLTEATEQELGSLVDASVWGLIFVGALILIPLLTEYLIANHLGISEDEINFERK